ncbi:MAG: hypothetical protein GXN98_03870, partial [Euryarchaeota archaeon]|nr:hypothetical protein [Euryarchaeota archaeon]
MSSELLPLVALSAGLRHGIDWDHIAAIMDITAVQRSRLRGVLLSFMYALGHASVVAALAIAGVTLGLALPEGVDGVMERLVGLTLLVLGVYVLYALRTQGSSFRLMPRWQILIAMAQRLGRWLLGRPAGRQGEDAHAHVRGYGGASAYTIGMIHGIGAETPTQVMLFSIALSAGAAGGRDAAVPLILFFIAGLVAMNTFMGIIGSFVSATRRERVYRALALVTALGSIALGLVFLGGATGYLPDLQALLGG